MKGIILTGEVTYDLRGLKGLWQCPKCKYKNNRYDSIKNTAYVSCEKCDASEEFTLDLKGFLEEREEARKNSKFRFVRIS